jgi:hypothetical protein
VVVAAPGVQIIFYFFRNTEIFKIKIKISKEKNILVKKKTEELLGFFFK